MATCRVSALLSALGGGGSGRVGYRSEPGVNCLEQGWEVWLDGDRRAYGNDLSVEGGYRWRQPPDLTSAHAHSCGVVPKADAAPC